MPVDEFKVNKALLPGYLRSCSVHIGVALKPDTQSYECTGVLNRKIKALAMKEEVVAQYRIYETLYKDQYSRYTYLPTL